MKLRYARWLAVLLLGLVGCGSPALPKNPGPPPRAIDPGPSGLWVGTARADLTMPPGPATFGHGPDARVADGYWTRTYCRVFLFVNERAQRLALVPCELPAMSMLLQRRVAERVQKVVHASQLMMTATHTHGGVGHFFGASQYTGIFSSRRPGYDDRLALELADRIADAILRAEENLHRAQLSWRHRDDFWCFTRNRSLSAYQLNRPPFVADWLPPCAQGSPELAAVDPSLDVLSIETFHPEAPARRPEPIGSISFFAMHPTVVHNTNQFFGGDAFGVISRNIEANLRREVCRRRGFAASCGSTEDPLHAVVNTNEGDISPVWHEGDIKEAIRVGDAVSKFVWESHFGGSPPDPRPVLDWRYVEEDIRGAVIVDDRQIYANCSFPEVGQGAARGGTDHRTSVAALSIFGSDSFVSVTRQDCQAPKVPLLGLLSRLSRGEGVFPSKLPLSVVRLADTLLAFVPAELTVTAGHRLKMRILSELEPYSGAPSRVVVAGLANEYIQYVATAEEYQLQDYEGASTLFGPNSARYFANRLGLLARSMFDPQVSQYLSKELGLTTGVTHDIPFKLGPSLATVIDDGSDFERQHLGTCVMPQAVKSSEPPRICMYWRDGGPANAGLSRGPWLSVVSEASGRRARYCFADDTGTCDPQAMVDDRGVEFMTRVHERVGPGWIWSTLFSPSAATWKEVGSRSSRIVVSGTEPVESEAFGGGCLPARCTPRQAQLCIPCARTDDWAGLANED
jgi:neutral ceramidase